MGKKLDDVQAPGVVAVGDLHGEYDSFLSILRDANLVDHDLNWIGSDALVVLGDILDRGPNAKGIMDLLMKLQQQAPNQISVLLGDHELFMMQERYDYVGANCNGFPSIEEMKRAFSAAGVYGKWLRELYTVVRIGDTLFVHAGVNEKYARYIRDNGPNALNELVWTAIREEDWSNPVFDAGQMRGGDLGVGGPFWMDWRELVAYTPAQRAEFLRMMGVSRVICGHTPSMFTGELGTRQNSVGVVSLDEGRYIDVDTGISPLYGGVLGYLRLSPSGEPRAIYPGNRLTRA